MVLLKVRYMRTFFACEICYDIGEILLKHTGKFWMKVLLMLALCSCFSAGSMALAEEAPVQMKSVRISWEPVPGAVSYQLAIMKNNENLPENIISVKKKIFSTGYELDTSVMYAARNYYWKVCPLNYKGEIMGSYSELKPLVQGDINPAAPKPNTQFTKMSYSPLYPVFSWIPHQGCKSYDIQVFREDAQNKVYKLVREIESPGEMFYEYAGYTWPGKYYWQVRGRDASGKVNSEWSEPSFFTVETPVKVAALGDSITHGGGAVCTPPSMTLYNWETYCDVPVKNLGRSGDTVQTMLDRFNTDVLSFEPKILVVMGGVNNFREGDTAWNIEVALEEINNKCSRAGIIPVFATATPVNPVLMKSTIATPAANWQQEQQLLNDWIMQQPYHVDVVQELTDENGFLKAEMTTDGLHPDMQGKKIIGEKISEYLLKRFPALQLEKK